MSQPPEASDGPDAPQASRGRLRTLASQPATLALFGVMVAVLLFGAFARYHFASEVVFPEGRAPRLLGTDAYYHLRHTRFVTEHYPTLQRYDVATHYPHGQHGRAPGLYDLTMATGALVAGLGSPTEDTLTRVVAFTPLFLGLIALLLTGLLARSLLGPLAAVLAWLVLSLYPGAFLTRTLLGFSDHHAAEAVLVVPIAWGLAATMKPPAAARRLVAWRRSWLHALPLAAMCFTWVGAPVHIMIVGLALTVWAVISVGRGRVDEAVAVAIFRYGSAATLTVLLLGVVRPNLVMFPAIFKYLIAGLAVIGLVVPGYLLVAARLLKRGVAAWILLLATLGGFTLVLLALSEVDLVGFLARRLLSSKTVLVAEHHEVTPNFFFMQLGWPGYLALLAPIIAFWRWRADAAQTALFITSLYGAMLLLLWLRVHDYEYIMPVVSALLASLSLASLYEWLPRRRLVRIGALALVGVLAVLPIRPFVLHPPPWGLRAQVSEVFLFHGGWAEATAWLAEESPEPALPTNALVDRWDIDTSYHYPEGAYGVLVAWDFGNLVAAMGRRSVVASQELNYRMARWLTVTGEERSLRYWSRPMESGERIRYVVVDAETMTDHYVSALSLTGHVPVEYIELDAERQLPIYNRRYWDTVAARLYYGLGSGMSHHRLVYQTRHKSLLYYRAYQVGENPDGSARIGVRLRADPLQSLQTALKLQRLRQVGILQTGEGVVYDPRLLPTIRIFEIVEGVRVHGTATPGADVEAILQLESMSDGERFLYRQRVDVAADGTFELHLPYSTDGLAPSNIRTEGEYRIVVIDGVRPGPTHIADVGVPEDLIHQGRELDLGNIEQRL